MEYSEKPLRKEHASHVGERREARRKLAIAGSLVLGLAGLISVGNNAEKALQPTHTPESYYDGKIEIILSDNLRVRETPIVITNNGEQPNTVEWDNIEEINGVKINRNESIIIEDPLITYGDDPAPEGTERGAWITFDAKVDNGLGLTDEKLYVSLSSATRDFVKPVEPGSFVTLSDLTSTEGLGTVTANPIK